MDNNHIGLIKWYAQYAYREIKKSMGDIAITNELLLTPRLLVIKNDGSNKPNYIEILLLEVSPSGLRMKYRTTGTSYEIWADVEYFRVIEILENKSCHK